MTSRFDMYADMEPKRYIIASSKEKTLVFESEDLYKQYLYERKQLHDKYYRLICNTSGIWAGNQNKFVKSETELNMWD